MATDRDRLSQDQQHMLQLLSSGPNPADNQAQQSVGQKTIYTRAELPPNSDNTVQPVAIPQTQPSAGQGDAKSTTISPRAGTSLAPNRSLTQIETEIDPQPGEQNQKVTGMQTEIDLNAEQDQDKKSSHNNNSFVPISNPIIRRSILNTENLSRKPESVPKEQEAQRANYIKDPRDIFGIGATKTRSSSPFEWYKNKLVKPIPREPVKEVQVLLPPRQLHHSCENLCQAKHGEGDGDGKSTNMKKSNSEDMLHSRVGGQEVELSSQSTVGVLPTLQKLEQKQRELRRQLQQLEYYNNQLVREEAQKTVEQHQKEKAKK